MKSFLLLISICLVSSETLERRYAFLAHDFNGGIKLNSNTPCDENTTLWRNRTEYHNQTTNTSVVQVGKSFTYNIDRTTFIKELIMECRRDNTTIIEPITVVRLPNRNITKFEWMREIYNINDTQIDRMILLDFNIFDFKPNTLNTIELITYKPYNLTFDPLTFSAIYNGPPQTVHFSIRVNDTTYPEIYAYKFFIQGGIFDRQLMVTTYDRYRPRVFDCRSLYNSSKYNNLLGTDLLDIPDNRRYIGECLVESVLNELGVLINDKAGVFIIDTKTRPTRRNNTCEEYKANNTVSQSKDNTTCMIKTKIVKVPIIRYVNSTEIKIVKEPVIRYINITNNEVEVIDKTLDNIGFKIMCLLVALILGILITLAFIFCLSRVRCCKKETSIDEHPLITKKKHYTVHSYADDTGTYHRRTKTSSGNSESDTQYEIKVHTSV